MKNWPQLTLNWLYSQKYVNCPKFQKCFTGVQRFSWIIHFMTGKDLLKSIQKNISKMTSHLNRANLEGICHCTFGLCALSALHLAVVFFTAAKILYTAFWKTLRKREAEYLETHCNWRTNQLPNGLSQTSTGEDIWNPKRSFPSQKYSLAITCPDNILMKNIKRVHFRR